MGATTKTVYLTRHAEGEHKYVPTFIQKLVTDPQCERH